MSEKLLVISVVTLLIVTTIPVLGIELNIINREPYGNEILDNIVISKQSPQFLPPWWLIGADQKQLIGEFGLWAIPEKIYAQEFKPTKDKLTAVALEFFKFGNPPDGVEIKVTIRKSLNGEDLAEKIINADIIQNLPEKTWVMFDFEDIIVSPEHTYFIMCSGGGGDVNNSSNWMEKENSLYSRGISWYSADSGETWTELQNWDFCFITYWLKPLNSVINNLFLQFLHSDPNMFPLLQILVHRFGLQ